MPIYEYVCVACGPFSQLRKIAEYEQPALCPHCQQQAPRVISAPRLAVMDAGNRTAWERNERSAHEPRLSQPHRHHPGCGHDHGKIEKQPVKREVGRGRPWMLGH